MSANDTLFSTTQTSGIASGLNQNYRNRARTVWRQDFSTNVSVENQMIQHGVANVTWPGGGTTSNTLDIIFPVAFDDTNIEVVVLPSGYKSGSAPTSRTDVTLGNSLSVAGALISASTFRIQVTAVASQPSSLVSQIMWIAIGTKA